jgi:hypothetical protein
VAEDPSQIRQDIEEAREQLGDTVEALAYKANAPRRAKDALNARIDLAKARAGDFQTRIWGLKPRAEDANGRVAEAPDHSAEGPNAAAVDGFGRFRASAQQLREHPRALAAAGFALAGIVLIVRRRNHYGEETSWVRRSGRRKIRSLR